MHWFDCFDLACRNTYGAVLSCINSGRGGDTTRDLITRIDRDCLFYQPPLVFLTIGGNDAWRLSVSEFRSNLQAIVGSLQSAGSVVALQTYYSVDLVELGDDFATTFLPMMDTVREIGEETGCTVIDHLVRWEPLRLTQYEKYRSLMADAMHVNEIGNIVLGLDIARAFGVSVPTDPYFAAALECQATMDNLSGQ
jgi:lysophospholipase L1-like esterase